MVNLLFAAALAAAPIAAPAAQPPEPAMFVVRDSDTTIYVFGTFHVLDGKDQWFGDKVRDAFERSDELVLETLIPERPSDIAAAPAVLRVPSVTASASFLATARMAIDAGRSQGMQANNGADMVLRRQAEAEGKPVEGWRRCNSSSTCSTTCRPRRRSPLRCDRVRHPAAAPIDRLSQAMGTMQAAWKRGDQSVFVNMLSQLKAASPETYQMMFTERNDRWADWIGRGCAHPARCSSR